MKKNISIVAIALLAVLLCGALVGCNNQSMVSFDVITIDFELFVPPFLSITPTLDGVYQSKTTTYVGDEIIDTTSKNATADNPLTWMPNQNYLDKQQKAIVEMMVVSDGQYIGYLVISVRSSARKADKIDISYNVVKEENFLQKDGTYKPMTKEQVQELINKAVQDA